MYVFSHKSVWDDPEEPAGDNPRRTDPAVPLPVGSLSHPETELPEFSVPHFPDVPFHRELLHEYKQNHTLFLSMRQLLPVLFLHNLCAIRHLLLLQ